MVRLKHILFALIAVSATQAIAADQRRAENIRQYCAVVENHIISLANTSAASNEEMAKYAKGQPTADPIAFEESRSLLVSVTQSLAENETEWNHLECAQILYPAPR